MSNETLFAPRCDYNWGVICEGDDCEKCGWKPEVNRERVERLRRGEPAVERRTEK